MGTKISDAKPGEIARGAAIATFDDRKQYPIDDQGKHAAIYLRRDATSILVLDHWNDQGEVSSVLSASSGRKAQREATTQTLFT